MPDTILAWYHSTLQECMKSTYVHSLWFSTYFKPRFTQRNMSKFFAWSCNLWTWTPISFSPQVDKFLSRPIETCQNIFYFRTKITLYADKSGFNNLQNLERIAKADCSNNQNFSKRRPWQQRPLLICLKHTY